MPPVSTIAQMLRDDEHCRHYKIKNKRNEKCSWNLFIRFRLRFKFLLCVIRSAGSVLVVDTRQVIYGRHIRLLLLLLFRIVVKIVMLLNYLVVHHLVLLLILVLLLKQIDSCAVEAASVSVYCRRLYSRMM